MTDEITQPVAPVQPATPDVAPVTPPANPDLVITASKTIPGEWVIPTAQAMGFGGFGSTVPQPTYEEAKKYLLDKFVEFVNQYTNRFAVQLNPQRQALLDQVAQAEQAAKDWDSNNLKVTAG